MAACTSFHPGMTGSPLRRAGTRLRHRLHMMLCQGMATRVVAARNKVVWLLRQSTMDTLLSSIRAEAGLLSWTRMEETDLEAGETPCIIYGWKKLALPIILIIL